MPKVRRRKLNSQPTSQTGRELLKNLYIVLRDLAGATAAKAPKIEIPTTCTFCQWFAVANGSKMNECW